MPLLAGLARDRPMVSLSCDGNGPVSYQNPSLYEPGSPADGFSAYWSSLMNSAPVFRWKLPPQRELPRSWESSLNGPPGGLSWKTPLSTVQVSFGRTRRRTPRDDSG